MPGTVWLKPASLADTVREIILGYAGQGIYRFLVVNGHGGNFCLYVELR